MSYESPKKQQELCNFARYLFLIICLSTYKETIVFRITNGSDDNNEYVPYSILHKTPLGNN